MKRLFLILLFFILCATSCLTDPITPSNEVDKPRISYDKSTLTRAAVTLTGTMPERLGEIKEFGFEMSESNFQDGDPHVQAVKDLTENNSFRFIWTQYLEPGKTFFFRSYISNGLSKKYSSIVSVQTKATSAATLSEIGQEGNRLYASIQDDGGLGILEVGFCWSESSDIQALKQKLEHRTKCELQSNGSFSLDMGAIEALELGKTYFFIAYAVNAEGGTQHTGCSDNYREVPITEAFPVRIDDPEWSSYLVSQFDADGDGRVSYEELKKVTAVDFISNEIVSVKGLELMPDLVSFSCRGTAPGKGSLEALDVSHNPKLTTLQCDNNKIIKLDVSQNPLLDRLSCAANLISDLSVSGNTSLKYLDCSTNRLRQVEVSQNAALTHLNVSGNQYIAALDVSQNAKLEHLECARNVLEVLDISSNRALSYLDCRDNPLSTIWLYANQRVSTMHKPEETSLIYLIDNLTLRPDSLTVTMGEVSTVQAVVDPDDAIDKTIVWQSSNPKVATVSEQGVVKGVSVDTCTISASCGGKTAFCFVTVDGVPVSEIRLNQTSVELTPGATVTLKAEVLPANATDKTVTWSTSNPAVATVSDNGLVRGVGIGTCTIKAAAGDKEATCQVTVQSIPVTGVAVEPQECEIEIGNTAQLSATVFPYNATNQRVTWSSDDESVATVSDDGVVTAVGGGNCRVSASIGEFSDACTVTVLVPVTGISLNINVCDMEAGETITLVATVSPEDATDKTVSWSSSNTSVAKVASNGVVTAVSEGTCTITATAGSKSATCRVTVTGVPVTSVTLSETQWNTTVGSTLTLVATVLPYNATDKTVTWSTTDASVATVSTSGVVNAVGLGSCTIQATAGGKSATCAVTVVEATIPVSSITLNTTSLSLTVGDTQSLTATVLPENATDKTVTWSSNDTGVATVSTSGLVTAVSAGTATITASAGGKSATCSVTVTSGGGGGSTVNSITISPTSYTLPVGGSTDLTVTVDPSDAAVTWTSSKESVAMVSQSGHVVAIAEGTSTITATAGDKSATCELTVIIPVTGISLYAREARIVVGATTKLYYEVQPDNASDKTVTWTSSESSVATVNSDGVVTGVGVGTAIVTASAGSFSATCDIIVSSSDGYVPINGNTFPDNVFRSYISTYYDEDKDGVLSPEEINKCTTVYVPNSSVSSLIGLEYLTSLKQLYCNNNNIKSLNLENNTELEKIECQMNPLNELDLRYNLALVWLVCYDDQLSSLDVSHNMSLEYIDCRNNNLKSLDVENHLSLFSLSCYNNQLEWINARGCVALRDLFCQYNQLQALELGGCSSLSWINCSNNHLGGLAVDDCPSLEVINCSSNQIYGIGLSSNTLLSELDCNNNKLAVLDLSHNLALTRLDCGNNSITSIDISVNTSLMYLSIHNNNLKRLNVNNNLALAELYCYGNSLTELDLSSNTKLTHIWCYDNQLTQLNLSNLSNLFFLTCGDNRLTQIDISHCQKLTGIHFANNNVSSLIATTCTELTGLSCQNNNLSELDVSYFPGINDLHCEGNQLTNLDLSSTPRLNVLSCSANLFTSLDFSNNLNLVAATCTNNPYLTEIWLKTGQTISEFAYDTNVATIKYKD